MRDYAIYLVAIQNGEPWLLLAPAQSYVDIEAAVALEKGVVVSDVKAKKILTAKCGRGAIVSLNDLVAEYADLIPVRCLKDPEVEGGWTVERMA